MTDAPIDSLPGFRRRILVTPLPGVARAEVEDDFHHMTVAVSHADGVATAIDAKIIRAPWTTCPGAEAALERTFIGARLKDFPKHAAAKPTNCTHLFDLAIWAAAHAADAKPTRYEVLVSDPVGGVGHIELRRGGATIFHWTIAHHRLTSPSELAGRTLVELNDWIAARPAAEKEAARILRWGALIAHGRAMPLSAQSDATKMPSGACFTFQPETASRAIRIGEIKELSTGGVHPLNANAS